jgi:putative flavoprotein involved in K+ transport
MSFGQRISNRNDAKAEIATRLFAAHSASRCEFDLHGHEQGSIVSELVETIVIGGGQAGLALSHHLAQSGREHVILERGRVAERWRSERWDSLHFQFPNWMIRLPGSAYDGSDPDGFSKGDDIVRFISSYAIRNGAPLRCGVNVTGMHQEEGGRLVVQAGSLSMVADNVVIATGPYQLPTLPSCAAHLPASVFQVTASRYVRPSQLPPGGVLVVGSGASGCQIVEDLLLQRRSVYYSLRGHRRVPRRYRGRDFGRWNEEMGLTSRTIDAMPKGFRPPLITGCKGGATVSLRDMFERGVTLLGSLRHVEGARAFFAKDINANLDAGDESFRQSVCAIDAHIRANCIDAPPSGEFFELMAIQPKRVPEVEMIDLHESGISTVIWAIGYGYDFGWINCDVLDAAGVPIQRQGVTTIPGVYFLGLPRMHKVQSAFLWGVGEDAQFIARQIESRRESSRARPGTSQ